MCILGACDLTRGVLSVRYQSGINQNLYENDYDYFVFIITVTKESDEGIWRKTPPKLPRNPLLRSFSLKAHGSFTQTVTGESIQGQIIA